jgi:predicted metal-dependent phosphoesterase TrpH
LSARAGLARCGARLVMKFLSEETAPYDFHLHTYWSYDATAEVEVHFRRARELNMRCIAITEHHHADSLPSVFEIAQSYPEIRAIPAAELSVSTSIGAVDLLCYGLPRDPEGTPLAPLFDRYHQWQREAGAAVSEGMCRLGFDYGDEVRLELLRTYRPEATIDLQGVTHVNNYVQRDFFLTKGFIRKVDEYGDLMKRVSQAVFIPPYPEVGGVVEAVHGVGGIIVIAHPQGYFLNADFQRMDSLVEECGLHGIECAHPSVAPELRPVYRDYCQRRGLLSFGGSDCHSNEDISKALGRHGGDPAWLEEILDRLDA